MLGARLLFLLALPLCALSACQCATLAPGARFRCEPDGTCPAGLRCARESEAEAGFCVPLSEDGGLLPDGGTPGGGVLDLVFDNALGAALVAFPVLVSLDATRVDYAAIARPSTDLRFFDPDTNRDLPFEIDTWNPAGESLVWVLVPEIGAGRTDDRITLFWGPRAAGQEDPTGYTVFGSNTAVWHLGPGPVTNSASAQYRGNATGGTVDPGRVGSARRFTGTGNQTIDFDGGGALFDGWGAFTLELWIRPEYASIASVTSEGAVLDKGGGLNLGRVFVIAGQTLQFQVDMHFGAAPNDTYLGTEVPLRTWTSIVYVFSGHALTLYADAQEVGRVDFVSNTTLNPGPNPFFLGGFNSPINGALDEVRIAQVARSPDWIRAQYRSITRQLIAYQPR